MNEMCEEENFENLDDGHSTSMKQPLKINDVEFIRLYCKIKTIIFAKVHPTWSLKSL